MTEEQIRAYADLRAKRLMLNGAQTWNFINRVIQHWLSGKQANVALDDAAKEVTCA